MTLRITLRIRAASPGGSAARTICRPDDVLRRRAGLQRKPILRYREDFSGLEHAPTVTSLGQRELKRANSGPSYMKRLMAQCRA
jgi:hypothetical protein